MTDSDYYSGSYSYTFDLTVWNRCLNNVLSVQTVPSDISYLIDDDGSTASQASTAYVSGNQSSTYCPLTRETQIWDDTSGDFITFSSGTYSWGSSSDNGYQITFTVDTESGTTLDSASIDESIFHVRVKTYDPYST